MSKGLKTTSSFTKLDTFFQNVESEQEAIQEELPKGEEPAVLPVKKEVKVTIQNPQTPKGATSIGGSYKREKKDAMVNSDLDLSDKRKEEIQNRFLKRDYDHKIFINISARITEIQKKRLDSIAFTYDVSVGVFLNNLVSDFWDKYGEEVQEDYRSKSNNLL